MKKKNIIILKQIFVLIFFNMIRENKYFNQK